MNEIVSYSSLKDKVILVTGGAAGIGESIVKSFLEQGSKVAFLDKDKKLGSELVNKLNSYDRNLLFKECDLVDIKDLKKKIREIQIEFGLISVLVNNAGNDERHNIDDVTPEFWDNRMNVNLRHYFLLHNLFIKI